MLHAVEYWPHHCDHMHALPPTWQQIGHPLSGGVDERRSECPRAAFFSPITLSSSLSPSTTRSSPPSSPACPSLPSPGMKASLFLPRDRPLQTRARRSSPGPGPRRRRPPWCRIPRRCTGARWRWGRPFWARGSWRCPVLANQSACWRLLACRFSQVLFFLIGFAPSLWRYPGVYIRQIICYLKSQKATRLMLTFGHFLCHGQKLNRYSALLSYDCRVSLENGQVPARGHG